jgi:Ca2+/Na+ antiporter
MMANSAETQTELEKRYRITALIVSGQIVLTVIFIAAALMFAPTSETVTSSNNLTYLWVGALFVAVGAFVLRRMLFRWDRLKDIFLLKGVSGLLGSLQKNAILLGAMAEAIAIIGLLIVFLSGNRYEMLRAGAIALVVFVINFPRKSVWKKIAANLENI